MIDSARPRCLVVIPTTEGPVTITGLLREPALSESLIALAGSNELAPLSRAYTTLLAQSDGDIALPGPWCLEVDKPIDTGESWQLGVALAHALERADRLAFDVGSADAVLWVTGALRIPDLRVNPVDHIARKFSNSTALLTTAAQTGKQIIVVLPADQAIETLHLEALPVASTQRAVVHARRLADVEAHLALPRRRWRLKRRHRPAIAALAAGIVGVGLLQHCSVPDRLFPPRPTGVTFQDCQSCPEMVVMPHGSYWLNDFEPPDGLFTNGRATSFVHAAKPFAVAKTEVTLGQYLTFLKETGYTHSPADCGVPTVTNDRYDWKTIAGGPADPGYVASPDHPVTCVSGHDAVAFAEWFSKKYKRRYRLPTSVEWEIIARAGTRSAFSFGDDESRICEYARFADAGTTLGRARRVRVTCPPRDSEGPSRVASLKPNAWGFFDTVGNAWEWTSDCPGSPGHVRAMKQAQSRLGECAFSLIGGGWNSVVVQLRPGHRDNIQSKPYHRTSVNGFRLAADVD